LFALYDECCCPGTEHLGHDGAVLDRRVGVGAADEKVVVGGDGVEVPVESHSPTA